MANNSTSKDNTAAMLEIAGDQKLPDEINEKDDAIDTMELQKIPRVPDSIDFSAEEVKVLDLWEKLDVLNMCAKQSKGKPSFTFYDGPPFATGLPHYGHILAGTIKDAVTRYAFQRGHAVERRFGWDCHGLPVEYEIDKEHGINGPKDVEKLGIENYNNLCRGIISRYVDEWKTVTTRMGRWIDFDNDYKTMYPWFMESVWFVFKQLYLKGLVYSGVKVMPYSTACGTPLSNFESGQNYKDVVDPAITVAFPLRNDQKTFLLIWTTTPWTLPSNLAVCVNPFETYIKVEYLKTGKFYIIMEARLESVFKPDEVKIIESYNGLNLGGLEYEPPFNYFIEHRNKGAFRVQLDTYVTAESGTGIVHQAPYFGEDDHRVCLTVGIITRDQEPVCPIDSAGRFIKPVTDFEGQYVKDADKMIIAHLKNNGLLFNYTQVKHSYPYCWRSDTPLIYRAIPSWFINVESMKVSLQELNSTTYWVPESVKEKRFGNWLKEARDWAISRNRYWGTPIPIWRSEIGEIFVVGSMEELHKLTGVLVNDLHRESIDDLVIPSSTPGNPPLKRIPEVFDCWFESGCMPYAQQHYPFENPAKFSENFPADFIAEGIDQTRGWFYTLLVISTALFRKVPFKNLIANGLVLASDGQKMSKRKKNYPDPMEIVRKYGADALRLYLINSPVVRAENLRFKEEGVRDVVKDVFLPWYNAFRFLFQNIENYTKEYKVKFIFGQIDNTNDDELLEPKVNLMDKWIKSFTQSLVAYVIKEMEQYHLYNVIPRLTKYIDQLTNWYVRMNRKRFKGDFGRKETEIALQTLFEVLFVTIRLMSPFSPFLTETMYQYMKQLMPNTEAESVHFLMYPETNRRLISLVVEREVRRLQAVVDLGRVLRDRKTIPLKYPLPEIVVIHQNERYISDIRHLEDYILTELNVRKLVTTTEKSKYGITLRAEPNFKVLGLRLKQKLKQISTAIQSLTDVEINQMIIDGSCMIADERIDISEIKIVFNSTITENFTYEVASDNDVLVLLNVNPDEAMQEEGIAREIVNRIQKLRKKAKLVPTDPIEVFYAANGDVFRIAKAYKNFIEGAIKTEFRLIEEPSFSDKNVVIEEEQTLKGCDLYLALVNNIIKPTSIKHYINVQLHNLKSYYCDGAELAVILVDANTLLDYAQLKQEITKVFHLNTDIDLFSNKGLLGTDSNIKDLYEKTIVAVPHGQVYTEEIIDHPKPFCKTHFDGKSTVHGLLENPRGISQVPGSQDAAGGSGDHKD